MAVLNFDLDENKIWLHAERVGDRLMIVDQDGRHLAGVMDAVIRIGMDDLTSIEITVESASRKEDGKLSRDFRG